MGTKNIRLVTELVLTSSLSYHSEKKDLFHRRAKAACKDIANALGLLPGSFDIRSNKGGIAVSGEVTLHGENIYIQLDQGSFKDQFMYRHCNGRKDYSGGHNRWMKWSDLKDHWDQSIQSFKQAQLGP